MKKVAIVSCYFKHNYGSMLQALATQMALDKIGYDNETIDISLIINEIRKEKFKYFIKAALTSDILLSKFGMLKNVFIKKLLKNEYVSQTKIRDTKFEDFIRNKFRLSDKSHSKKELTQTAKKIYSSILVGSDQLWLPGNIAGDYYTLNWTPDGINTIAYATSFGQAILPNDSKHKATVFLNHIKHIGVREERGQSIVKELTGRNVPIVCDPTLLFTGNDWLSIQDNAPLYNEPYIFVYFLGNNPIHREFVKNLKEETGYRIVALLHIDEYIKSDEGYADYTPYDIGPAEFLNLIRHSRYVCTDSFHCSVFSILYEKKFFSFRRYTRKTASSTNSRLDTLFKLTGIKNRILNGDEDIQDVIRREIDYTKVHSNLELVRSASYEYLMTALLDNRDTDLC